MEHQLAKKSTQKEQPKESASSSSLQPESAERAITHPALRLQRVIGNQAVQRMVPSGNMDVQGRTYIGMHRPDVSALVATPVQQVLQRKCACGGTPESTGECAECKAKHDATLQRSAGNQTAPSAAGKVPPTVHEVLHSPGQHLDAGTRAFMEPRFGHDFSHVRVHTDAKATESAQEVNALAYTVGQNVVFDAGQYAPETNEGKRLLGHELTHVVQQNSNGTDTSGMQKLLIGAPGDALERQADAVANRVAAGDSVALHTVPTASAPTLQRASLGDIWEGTKNVASSVGGTIASVGEGAWEGAKSVASTVGGAVVSAGQTVGGVVSTGVKLATGEISLAELIGIPEPSGDSTTVLAIIVRVLQNPVVQALPGFILPPFVLEGLKKALLYVQAVWKMMQNPGAILEMIKGYLQQKIDTVPGKIEEALAQVSSVLGDKGRRHLKGIWRHLEPKLEELKNNWWSMLKEMGKDLINPFPKIWKEMENSWAHVKDLATHVWHGKFSQATDDYLALLQSINSIAGLLSFLLTLGLVIGFAIAGGVAGAAAGGVGAVPGALAGAATGFAIAAEIGEAILIATVAVETAILLKSVYNLASVDQTQEEQEADYERIANSGLTLGITGAIMLLGALAARLAKAIIQSAKAVLGAGARETGAAVASVGAEVAPTAEAKGAIPGEATAAPPAEPTAEPAAEPAPKAKAALPAELEQLNQPIELAGKSHTLSLKRIGNELKVWLCSNGCGELIAKAEAMLDRLPKNHPGSRELEAFINTVQNEATWIDVVPELEDAKIRLDELKQSLEQIQSRHPGVVDPDVPVTPTAPATTAEHVPVAEPAAEPAAPKGDVFSRNSLSMRGLDPDRTLADQLGGAGQLKDLQASPNLKGVGADDLPNLTPRQLAQMVEDGKITKKVFDSIMKTGEDRNLGR